ncbi:gamma-glutamyl-GABA hydrolase [Psychrobacter sp. JCM 18900]|nr:gamma-glutamyl-GABA hydrolase [Psychrobacter sp. JCM 18900]
MHKQAISEVGERLFVEALAPDGLVEAISLLQHPFMIGVQWHPELNYAQDSFSKFLFTEFIHHAREPQTE